jgi:hypothetical protein
MRYIIFFCCYCFAELLSLGFLCPTLMLFAFLSISVVLLALAIPAFMMGFAINTQESLVAVGKLSYSCSEWFRICWSNRRSKLSCSKYNASVCAFSCRIACSCQVKESVPCFILHLYFQTLYKQVHMIRTVEIIHEWPLDVVTGFIMICWSAWTYPSC